ncbi:hypothetical protein EDB85DRAFT_314895 [Lactarius pseudohatsudake]|nr:hypothetical protein EDB85DRAFT_314895 [Lactarius pseudohatsudake]
MCACVFTSTSRVSCDGMEPVNVTLPLFRKILNAGSDTLLHLSPTTALYPVPLAVALTLTFIGTPAMHSYTIFPSVVHSKISSTTYHRFLSTIITFSDLHVTGPAKQVERSDRQLQHAQALYEGYQAAMSPQDRDLARDLLTYSGDLRYDWEDKYLATRIKQARLYCSCVNNTLQMIQVLRSWQRRSIYEPTVSNSESSPVESSRSTRWVRELLGDELHWHG